LPVQLTVRDRLRLVQIRERKLWLPDAKVRDPPPENAP
jgi:hypothetical protein